MQLLNYTVRSVHIMRQNGSMKENTLHGLYVQLFCFPSIPFPVEICLYVYIYCSILLL